jgi:membrane-associated phospholipid phosphatase
VFSRLQARILNSLLSINDNRVKKLVSGWFDYVGLRLAPLVAAIGSTGLAMCLAILLGLSWLFHEVLGKEAFQFDTSALLWLHQRANPTLDVVMLKVTKLGNPERVVPLVIFSFGWLCWRRAWPEARMFAIACLGAYALNQGLKLVFVKDRPQLWTQLINESSFSFPSGHALGTLVLYGFLAYVLATRFSRFSGLIFAIAAVIIAAIGFSRLYLGVHWPTDVIAGYAVGFLWLTICITMLKLQTPARAESLRDS